MSPAARPPRLYSLRKGSEPPPPGAIRIDRGTPWGNPFKIRTEADRALVIEQFRAYALDRLHRDPHWLDPLVGRDLICWCWPKACHGDVLLAMAGQRSRYTASGGGAK